MKTLLKDTGLWKEAALIDGRWVSQTPHGSYDLRNPANGELLVKLPRCKEAEVTEAIVAADVAFRAWRKTTAKHRSEVLRRWYELVVANRDDLATLITLEEGSRWPRRVARSTTRVVPAVVLEEAKRVRATSSRRPRTASASSRSSSRSASAPRSRPGTFPAAMIAPRPALRWRPAARWSSSRPARRR